MNIVHNVSAPPVNGALLPWGGFHSGLLTELSFNVTKNYICLLKDYICDKPAEKSMKSVYIKK